MPSRLHFLASIAAFGLGIFGVQATAAEPAVWFTAHSLTVALTISYTIPGTVVKDYNGGKPVAVLDGGGPASENTFMVETLNSHGIVTKSVLTSEEVTKSVSVKYGNAEILKRLAQDGVLPTIGSQASPSAAGWSLICIDNRPDSGIGTTSTYYARHAASKKMVPLSRFSLYPSDGYASNVNYKYVSTAVVNPNTGDETETSVYSGSGTTKCYGYGGVPFEDFGIMATGIFTETGTKVVVKTETFPGDKIITPVWVPGARKLDKIGGNTTVHIDYNGYEAVVEGTMSLSAGTVIDMNVYNPSGS